MFDCSGDAPEQKSLQAGKETGKEIKAKQRKEREKTTSGKLQKNDDQSKQDGVDGLQILSQNCYFSSTAYRNQSDFLSYHPVLFALRQREGGRQR